MPFEDCCKRFAESVTAVRLELPAGQMTHVLRHKETADLLEMALKIGHELTDRKPKSVGKWSRFWRAKELSVDRLWTFSRFEVRQSRRPETTKPRIAGL